MHARRGRPSSSFRYFNSSPEVDRLVMLTYVRFPPSLPNEDLLSSRVRYLPQDGTDDLPLTHENMLLMLGVRRASITQVVHNLEAESLIQARRGLITIRDRCGLERYCGGFYGVAEARYAEIMGGYPTKALVKATDPGSRPSERSDPRMSGTKVKERSDRHSVAARGAPDRTQAPPTAKGPVAGQRRIPLWKCSRKWCRLQDAATLTPKPQKY